MNKAVCLTVALLLLIMGMVGCQTIGQPAQPVVYKVVNIQ